ncbi:hypothetical protein [Mucilaginibacter boryungensis]|uniref:Uncharacterized protein n=1 Tax=Mucilaginibacter boryungensis TaxID=768480 RepID=A0ABR9XIK4_9SPHI|nr:hypothetical protein [Mucilaginibacter boryungensis]MBE9667212.1 hypothetical protein [Mucilaginibacter boryungensis]
MPVLFTKVLGFVIVFILSFPPLLLVYKQLKVKHRLGMMAVLCLGPMIIMMLYEFKLLALVINQGFLAQAHVLGVADFIYLHTALMGVIMIIYKDWLIKKRAFFAN